MNKNLVVISLSAIFSTSVEAMNLYTDDTSWINLDAEIRLLAVAQEDEAGEGFFTKDDGSRLTASFGHRGELASMVGTVQIRFADNEDEDNNDIAESNNTYTKLLFGGLESEYGTLLGGRQYTFVDDAGLQDVSYNFGDTIAMGSDYDASVVKYTHSTDNYTVGLLMTIPSSELQDSEKTVQMMIKTHVSGAQLQIIVGQDDVDGQGAYFNADMGYTVDDIYFGAAVNYLDQKGDDAILGYGFGAKYYIEDVAVYGGFEDTNEDNSSPAWYFGGDYAVARASVIFVELGEHENRDGLSLELGLRTSF